MRRTSRTAWAAIAILAAATVGCNTATPGTSRSLGAVEYTKAFVAGKDVMSQYYSVASADAEKGIIRARPKPTDAPKERILGGSPARHLATLRLRDEGKAVIAYATVALQRQGGEVLGGMPAQEENYTTVPNRTPAERTAATTVEQNESWRTVEYDHQVERAILRDLFGALHPQAP